MSSNRTIKKKKENLFSFIIQDVDEYLNKKNVMFNSMYPKEILEYYFLQNKDMCNMKKRYYEYNSELKIAESEEDPNEFKIELYDLIENKKIICSRKKLKKESLDNFKDKKKSLKSTYFLPWTKKGEKPNGYEKLQQISFNIKKPSRKVCDINGYDELCKLLKNANFNESKKYENTDKPTIQLKKMHSEHHKKINIYYNKEDSGFDMSGYNSDNSTNIENNKYNKNTKNIINLIDLNDNLCTCLKSNKLINRKKNSYDTYEELETVLHYKDDNKEEKKILNFDLMYINSKSYTSLNSDVTHQSNITKSSSDNDV